MTPVELACLWRLSPPLEAALSLLRDAGRAPPAEVPALLEAAAAELVARARVLRALAPAWSSGCPGPLDPRAPKG